MRILLFVLLSGLFFSCNGTENKVEETEEVRVIANDTIPSEREKVSRAPVASYTSVVPDELNKFEFSVKLFETPLRFRYLVAVKYKMMDVKDSVDIPNFGHQPKVDVRRLDQDQACMIGFYDKDGNFKDLKKVEAVGGQLKIRQVRRYGVGTVRKK